MVTRRSFLRSGVVWTGLLWIPKAAAQQSALAPRVSSFRSVSASSGPPSANLAEHLDATTISGSDGDAIGTWTATVGRNATSTLTARPTLKTGIQNGLQVLRFDGSNDYMQTVDFASALSQPYCLFVVFKMASIPGVSTYIVDDNNITTRGILATRGNAKFEVYAGTNYELTSQNEVTSWLIASVEFNGASTKTKWNGGSEGTLSSSPGTHSRTGLTIGAAFNTTSGPAPMDVGEVLIYSGSIADKSSHFSYLNTKWAVY